jgi:hypothetical protein
MLLLLLLLWSEEESTLNLQALQDACPNAPWSLTVSHIVSIAPLRFSLIGCC